MTNGEKENPNTEQENIETPAPTTGKEEAVENKPTESNTETKQEEKKEERSNLPPKRQYLPSRDGLYYRRYFGFDIILDDDSTVFIQGSPYIVDNNRIEIEGWVYGKFYDNLNELMTTLLFSEKQKQETLDKINKYVNI